MKRKSQKLEETPRQRIMRVCGINATAVSQMGRNGQIIETDGVVDFDETLRQYIERMRARRAQTADQAERLTRAKADLAELEYDRERGALCDVRQVAAVFAELHRACERAQAADKTGLIAAAMRQALQDWQAATNKVLTKEDQDDQSEN
jgi:hypothetical protein